MFLGLDCSGVTANMGLLSSTGQYWHEQSDTPRQADVIFPMLNMLFANAELNIKKITAIGAITGPGSFTGIRVGLALAQGLADGLGIPCYGLDAFTAMQKFHNDVENPIVLESKRDELFVYYNSKAMMQTREEIIATYDQQKILHNLTPPIPFLPMPLPDLAHVAAKYAQECLEYKRSGKILSPYYLRDPDAKPSLA